MNFSVAQFTQVARSNWFNNDIVVSQDGSHISSKFFHTKSTNPAAQVTNQATMNAFRTALRAEFGSYGELAFQELKKTREGHSLRKSDVLNTVKLAQTKQKADAISEGWVNVSLSDKEEFRDLDLVRGGFRGLAELAWTAVRNNPSYPYAQFKAETQKANQNRAMNAFEERMKDDAFVTKLADSYEKNPKVLEDVMLRLAVYGEKAPLDEVLDNVVAQPEAKVAQPEVKVEAQPEAKVAQPEAKVAQPEVNKAKPEVKVAQPKAKVAQPEAKIAQPEAKVEAKVEQVKVEASKNEGKKDFKRFRRDLRGLAENAWANLRTSPNYPYIQFPKKVQDLNQERAMKAFDKRMKDNDLVLKLAKSYENDPKTLEAVMLRFAVYAEKAPLDEVLKID